MFPPTRHEKKLTRDKQNNREKKKRNRIVVKETKRSWNLGKISYNVRQTTNAMPVNLAGPTRHRYSRKHSLHASYNWHATTKQTGLPGVQQLLAATSDFFRPLLSGGPKDHVHFAIFTTSIGPLPLRFAKHRYIVENYNVHA